MNRYFSNIGYLEHLLWQPTFCFKSLSCCDLSFIFSLLDLPLSHHTFLAVPLYHLSFFFHFVPSVCLSVFLLYVCSSMFYLSDRVLYHFLFSSVDSSLSRLFNLSVFLLFFILPLYHPFLFAFPLCSVCLSQSLFSMLDSSMPAPPISLFVLSMFLSFLSFLLSMSFLSLFVLHILSVRMCSLCPSFSICSLCLFQYVSLFNLSIYSIYVMSFSLYLYSLFCHTCLSPRSFPLKWLQSWRVSFQFYRTELDKSSNGIASIESSSIVKSAKDPYTSTKIAIVL